MLSSTETRWFLNKISSKEVENWFNAKGVFFKSENLFPRQDYYLKQLDKNLGVKIREPKKDENGNLKTQLEIKILSNDIGATKFNNGNNGYVNSWKKFSFSLVPNEAEMSKIINSFTENSNYPNDWIKIDKDRLLIKFNTKSKSLVSSDSIIDEGAGIELTKLKINETVYFSLGIEAFSTTNKELENFNATTNFLFNDLKIAGLDKEDSLTYPEKLISILK